MKSLIFISFVAAVLCSQCTDTSSFAVPKDTPDSELVHFSIYIEFLPDSTLNQDEQCWQAHELRLLSRAGYDITFYRVFAPPQGESVARVGTTNDQGNYLAYDLPPATYHLVVTDAVGTTQDAIITPAKGAVTKATFSFHISKN